MQRLVLLIGMLLFFSVELSSQQNINAVWDANSPSENVTNYVLKYGTSSGVYDHSVDTGTSTQTVVNLNFNTKYYFTVFAIDNLMRMSPMGNEVSYLTAQSDPCLPPFGNQAITITPLRFTKTGSQGAGSLAEIYFLIQSVSFITHIAIKTNGVEIPDSIQDGVNLKSSLGLRFTLPNVTGNYTFSIFTKNLSNCTTEKLTSYSVNIP